LFSLMQWTMRVIEFSGKMNKVEDGALRHTDA